MSTASLKSLQALEPSQLRLLGYGGLGLVLVVLLVYLVLPQWRAYQSVSTSLTLLRKGAADGASLEVQLSDLGRQVQALEKTLNGDASNLPVKQMEAFIIGRLQTISWRQDMILVGVQPREGTPVSEFRELVFDIDLEGSYLDFFNWLTNIDEELGFVVVKRFEISPASRASEDGAPRLRIKLTMAAYRNAT